MRKSHKGLISGVFVLAGVMCNVSRAHATDPTTGDLFQFEEFYSPYKCFGTWGGSMNNGAQIIEWSCNPGNKAKDQTWMFDTGDCITTSQNGKFCAVKNGMNEKKCLGTYAGSTSEDAYLVIWDCLGQQHFDQYWQFQQDGETGCWQILNFKSALWVDAQWFQVCSGSCGPDHIWQVASPGQRWCPWPATP